MDRQTAFVIWFNDLGLADVPLVGGKNAALGEMFHNLTPLGVKVPDGFAITAHAYNYFLDKTGLRQKIAETLSDLDTKNLANLRARGEAVRHLILNADFPPELNQAITENYGWLGGRYGQNPDVAVRSSATAEDLPGASFAGQQDTFLNIVGPEALLVAVKKCMASLFNNRAISYRQDKGFDQTSIALSVSVQKMVRSDSAASGVLFTIDTETGFREVLIINSSYGLGEMVVQGAVTPDEFIVFKPLLKEGKPAIIAHDLGRKDVKMIYSSMAGRGGGGKRVRVKPAERERFSITDEEVLKLAEWGIKIEDYFSGKHGHHQPMDIEWAKDGETGELFIVQARPETVHSERDQNIYPEYRLGEKGTVLITGAAVGTKIATGAARVIREVKNLSEFKAGEVLVTEITDPDWEPIMKIAAAIVTDRGGRTSHAAIVSRELGIPCIVGTGRATKLVKTGAPVTVDCSGGQTGTLYAGKLKYEIIEHHLDKVPTTRTKILVNIGSPEDAFRNHYLPVDGVGLGRLEFIINSHIKIHPNALIDYPTLVKATEPKKRRLAKTIAKLTPGYADKKSFYVDELAEGIAKIAAAFWPREVIIRFSDFKTNEYRTLIGGEFYEPEEENPMLGWRGASRYYHPDFRAAFGLECAALKRAREVFGFLNIVPMIPFARTPAEVKQVLETMAEFGLRRGENGLKVYLMGEIPSNIILADEFLKLCDGMSIGSNDLTQLVLGLDRDSQIVSGIANENNPAVKMEIARLIASCRKQNKYIGICGQAPSDFPDFARFLVEKGITSISLNPDTVIKMRELIAQNENQS